MGRSPCPPRRGDLHPLTPVFSFVSCVGGGVLCECLLLLQTTVLHFPRYCTQSSQPVCTVHSYSGNGAQPLVLPCKTLVKQDRVAGGLSPSSSSLRFSNNKRLFHPSAWQNLGGVSVECRDHVRRTHEVGIRSWPDSAGVEGGP